MDSSKISFEQIPLGFELSEKPEDSRERARSHTTAYTFVLQSASPAFIKTLFESGIDPKDIEFTHTAMALEYDGDSNPFLCPTFVTPKQAVGPKRGRLARQIEHQLFEQGRIRSIGLQIFGNYSSGKELKRLPKRNIFVHTTASPFDELYQKSDETASASFVYMRPSKMRSLLEKGQITVPNISHPIQLAVNLEGKRKELPLSDPVKKKLLKQVSDAETEKKKEVARAILTLSSGDADFSPLTISSLLNKVNAAQDLASANVIYAHIVTAARVTPERVIEAVRLANIREEISYLDTYCNEIEAVLRILALLPQIKQLSHHALDVFLKSKSLGPLASRILSQLKRSRPWFYYLFRPFPLTLDEIAGSSNETHPIVDIFASHKETIDRLDPLDPSDIMSALIFLEKYFRIPRDDYYDLGRRFDTFYETIIGKYVGVVEHRGRREASISHIEQLNDIANCSPVDLLQIALGVGSTVKKYAEEGRRSKFDGETFLHRLIYEAQRKLFLMTAVHDAITHHKEKMRQGNVPFQTVWKSISSTPTEPLELREVRSRRQNTIVDIISELDHQIYQAEATIGKIQTADR